jgi:hypothetical protein
VRCSSVEIWERETSLFFERLVRRGYSKEFLVSMFQAVNFEDRESRVSGSNSRKERAEFFKKNKGIFLSLTYNPVAIRNAPRTDLKRFFQLPHDVPERVSIVYRNAPGLGSLVRQKRG